MPAGNGSAVTTERGGGGWGRDSKGSPGKDLGRTSVPSTAVPRLRSGHRDPHTRGNDLELCTRCAHVSFLVLTLYCNYLRCNHQDAQGPLCTISATSCDSIIILTQIVFCCVFF